MSEIPITAVDRPEPPIAADERTMLQAWLDYHRATLWNRCAGLTEEQLRTAAIPTTNLTLIGLVRHMTDVENGWFGDFALRWSPRYYGPDNPDGEFDDVATADIPADVAAFRAEWALSDSGVATLGLDHEHTDERGRTFSLRWVYTHMIEEYARHNGHADLIREAIDGTTGE